MTIVSTAGQTAPSAKQGELRSFPPIDDSIDFIKQVDWQDVRRRCHDGFNNVGLVIAVIGEKVHDFGSWMAKV
jgi:hypothetical protein